jgi:nondiscriminating glutamyl-tRNA synthetase
MFRTRFAPSPTGYLHLGTARTLLHVVLLTKHYNGSWFFRLEDTDRNRLNPEALKVMINDVYSLGLFANEGISLDNTNSINKNDYYDLYQNGEAGPYIQSERIEIYQEYAQKLINQKLCYWSYITPEEKLEIQHLKQLNKSPINWFNLSSEKNDIQELYADVSKALDDVRKPALRFRLQRNNKVTCNDEILGQTVFDLSLEEDPVFLKNDGFPTYHLAHLIDDKLMNTTIVIRSQEWYPSFALHTTMYEDFWGKESVLKYIHIPFILGESGNKKMSKRDGNVNMRNYLDTGYLPEAIINYLAFLGWNPGNEKELYLD